MTREWEVSDYKAGLQSWSPVWRDLVAELQPYQKEDLTEEQQATIAALEEQQATATTSLAEVNDAVALVEDEIADREVDRVGFEWPAAARWLEEAHLEMAFEAEKVGLGRQKLEAAFLAVGSSTMGFG